LLASKNSFEKHNTITYIYKMKRIFSLFIPLLLCSLCYAGDRMKANVADTSEVKGVNVVEGVAPQYPGGIERFNTYLRRNLQYPWAARLMYIKGNVFVSFVIDDCGKVTNVAALNCLGAGCESEAIKVVQNSRNWKPAIKNRKAVSTNYIIPVNFYMEPEKVFIENLAASGYGFIFNIKGKLYSVDEAEDLLGKVIKPEIIESAEPYHTDDTRFKLQRKKGVFLITVK
jgi:protein TonB